MLILSLCISSTISFSDDTTNPKITKEEIKKIINEAIKVEANKITKLQTFVSKNA